VKYTAAPTAVVLNPASDGSVAAVDPRTPGNVRFDGTSNRIEGLQARTAAGHCAGLVLEPAFPDIARLRPDVLATGDWRLAIDDNPAVVGGTWTVERRQDHVHVFLDITRGWRPRGYRRSWRPSPGSLPSSASGRQLTAGRPPSPSVTRHC
jgi:hypothetical protein